MSIKPAAGHRFPHSRSLDMAKARRLDSELALERVDLITPLLIADIWHSLTVRAVLEGANMVVGEFREERATWHGDTYNITLNALVVTLALALARVVDVSEKFEVESQDKASIPVLAALLSRPDVKGSLVDRAKDWFSNSPNLGADDCRRSLEAALKIHRDFEVEPLLSARKRIREFRTSRLAHHLFDKQPDELPRFSDLSTLAEAASDFAHHVNVAVLGINRDYGDAQRTKLELSQRLWRIALSALCEHTNENGDFRPTASPPTASD